MLTDEANAMGSYIQNWNETVQKTLGNESDVVSQT